MSSRSVFLIALLAALVFGACSRREADLASSQTPVLLISIDTLRSDHLPVYGYGQVKTPNIDSLRRDSILCERAYAHVPLTLPSHATMLTGLYPAENGVRDNLGFALKPEVSTLPELLQRNGYATGAAVSSFVMRGETGLARGFDFYEDKIDAGEERLNPGAVQRSGFESARIANQWIASHRERPFFFMLHVYEPHWPYDPPDPYRQQYQSLPYDGEVAAADAIVGTVTDFLKQNDLYDRMLVILVSDHGEGLLDHGEEEHGIFLYREAIQVPLLVKLPGSRHAGKSTATPVQLSDIFATIASMTATPFDGSKVRGESVIALLDHPRERTVFSESYFAELHFGWSALHSLTDGKHHFIQAPSVELYDLTRDPQERRNIAGEDRRKYRAMQQALEPLVSPPSERREVSAEEARKLGALGYLGAGATASPGPKPDPKSQLETLQEIKRAFGLLRERRDDELIPLLQKLLRENPAMLDLWDALSRVFYRNHRYEEAVEAAKQGLRISPASSHLAAVIANSLLELARYEEAAAHAHLMLERDAAAGHEVLARIYLAQKNYDKAREQAELAAGDEKERIAALLTLARIENERGDPTAALSYVDQVSRFMTERRIENVARVHFTRGDALARLGRLGEAEREFREEIRRFPRDPQAYKNLFLLYLLQRRVDAARSVFLELEKNGPTVPAYLAMIETLRAVGDAQGARYWARRGRERFPGDRRLRELK